MKKISEETYLKELTKLQQELVHLQEWVKAKGLKVVVLFEGRDGAGKGGVIKRITEMLNPRSCRVVALSAPTETEKGQWYFQRYANQLPTAGEIVLFDRSWYNRAVVEPVMGYCTKEQTKLFYETCPAFEKMLMDNGIILIKYWLSISKKEQEKRLRKRIEDPAKTWKFSSNDLKAYEKWDDFTDAEVKMFEKTHTKTSPWFVVEADDKKKARLNCIQHLLAKIPYKIIKSEAIDLPDRGGDEEEKIPAELFIKEKY